MASISTVACVGYTVVYVGSLYVVPGVYRRCLSKKRVSKSRSRNDPQVVVERLWSVSIATLVCMGCAAGFVWRSGQMASTGLCAYLEVLQHLGLFVPGTKSCYSASLAPSVLQDILHLGKIVFGTAVLTCLAYLGTLYTDFVEGSLPGQRNFRWPASRLQFMRNFVVAPISEELVFRSSMLVTTQTTDAVTPQRMIYITPLYFGIAHLHHAYEVYCQQGKSTLAMKRAVLSAAIRLYSDGMQTPCFCAQGPFFPRSPHTLYAIAWNYPACRTDHRMVNTSPPYRYMFLDAQVF
ncbi:CAAX prenyl protease [Malassezia psittaci]|uniref:intramembrane prenyl-peptidase Rce1 n=1 Tax=Malassezia psittaci TaxID=1821823 RepID=A0AAF0FAH6_9BASI|nr:CAAX prenyl protease [Malassezia psittaci]